MKFSFLINKNSNINFCYSYNHFYRTISNYLDCSEEVDADTSHYILVDFGQRTKEQLGKIIKYHEEGMKVIICTFDPPNFSDVDQFVRDRAVDKVIVFDQQFMGRFRCKMYCSDFIMNKHLFPSNIQKTDSKQICIYGSLMSEPFKRENIWEFPKIDSNANEMTYQLLYERLINYNGAVVFDSGWNEDMGAMAYYNRAKPVEILLCGRNPYCFPGIKTKRYDEFLKTNEQIVNPVIADIDIEKIQKINDETIHDLLEQLVVI